MIVRELDLALDAFEGPFDLLLTLVLKEELDLRDVGGQAGRHWRRVVLKPREHRLVERLMLLRDHRLQADHRQQLARLHQHATGATEQLRVPLGGPTVPGGDAHIGVASAQRGSRRHPG